MAQADYIISNQTFPNTRADINNHLSAIATNNSGTSAPTTQYAGQFWIDTTTTTWTLYIHDGTDDIQFATIDTSANTVNFIDSALDVVTDTTPQLGGDLDLNSNDITGTGNINITGTATVSGDLTVDTTTLVVDSADNRVAINKGTPDYTLDVSGDIRVGVYNAPRIIFMDTANEANSFAIKNNNSIFTIDNVDASGTSQNAIFRVDHQSSEAMRIDSSGNVGIGVVPQTWYTQIDALQVGLGGSLAANNANPSRTYLSANAYFNASNQETYIATDEASQYFQNAGNHIFKVASSGTAGTAISFTEAMKIDNSGNVILNQNGTGSDNIALRIIGGETSGFSNVQFADSADVNVGMIQYSHASNYMQFTTNDNEAMRIDSSGNVFVGRTSQVGNGIFVVEGNGNVLELYRPTTSAGANVFVGYSDIGGTETGTSVIEANGDFESATNNYGATSDINLKQQITNASSQWEDIKALQIKNYKFNNLVEQFGDEAPRHLGVIAQDLEASGMNGLVDVNESGTKSVKYSILYMKAVKALQEAMQKIEDLEARVNTLEGN